MIKEDSSKKLPVFVFPEELKFLKNDRKQVLTLYNPYDVTLNYKVLSNAPHHYRVVDTQGQMKPHCCVDVVICYLSPDWKSLSQEKFRVDFFQGTKLIGRKQIPVKLVDRQSREDDQVGELNEFKDIPNSSGSSKPRPDQTTQQQPQASSAGSVWVALIGIISLLVMLLPLENESSSWPSWIHVTVSMKLMAAFVLGLTTMVILKS